MRPLGMMTVAIALVTLGACTALYGPSSEEFTGARSDGGTSSTGLQPDGAPGGDADGSSSSGTSASASSSSSGAPAFVCPNAPLICDDFEVASPVFVVAGNPDGVKVVDGGHASSKALAVTFREGKAAMYEAKFTGQPHVEMSLWIRVDTPPPGGPELHFRVASLLFGAGCDWELSWQIWLQHDGLHQGADVYDEDINPSCGPVKFTSKPIFTAAQIYDGRWHHLVIDADASGRIRTTSVRPDDLAPVTEAVDSESGKVPSELQVDIGVPCVQEIGGCFPWEGDPYTVYFDQVILTTK